MFRELAVALAVPPISAGAAYAGEWARLSDRNAGFCNGYGTINAGRHGGKFKRFKPIVCRNGIKLNSINVLYGNDEAGAGDVIFDRHILSGGEAVLPQPHGFREGRFIRGVKLHYRSRPDFRGGALIELLGPKGLAQLSGS